MAFEPEDGILARYFCGESLENPCEKCAPRGGGMYFFIGKEPPIFKFEVLGTPQRTRTIYTGIGEAREIDACSDVPALEEQLPHKELADKISDKTGYPKWQRALKMDRVKKIGEFWSNPTNTNQICNSVVLAKGSHADSISGYAFETEAEDPADNDDQSTPTQKTVTTHAWYRYTCPGGQGGHNAEENLSDLLEQYGRVKGGGDNSPPCDKQYVLNKLAVKQNEDPDYRLWSDHCPDADCRFHKDPFPGGRYRPFEIVDGQHRTRGVCSVFNAVYENHDPEQFGNCLLDQDGHNTNPTQCENECGPDQWQSARLPTRDFLPFTLLPWGDEDEQAKARVFTDITTRGEDMEPLHKLSMLWRFSLPDGKVTQWKGQEFDFDGDTTHTKAYELCLALCKNELDQTSGRIPPIITKNQDTLIHLKELLMEHILKWMGANKIFDDAQVYVTLGSTNQLATAINRYLNAWAYWLSGPMGGPSSPATDKRIWTPSHRSWDHTLANPADRHPHFTLPAPVGGGPAVQYKPGHKIKQTTGGYFQEHQTTPQKDMAIGLAYATTLMHLVFDLYPTIVESILKDKFDDIPANAGTDWQSSMVASIAGSNVIHITEQEYIDKLEAMLKQNPVSQQQIIFGNPPFEKEEYRTPKERGFLIDRLIKKFEWL